VDAVPAEAAPGVVADVEASVAVEAAVALLLLITEVLLPITVAMEEITPSPTWYRIS